MNKSMIEDKLIIIIKDTFKIAIDKNILLNNSLLGNKIKLNYYDLLLLYTIIKQEFNKEISWEFISMNKNFAYISSIANYLSFK